MAEETLAADRRVLVIAAAAMVGLVMVGVVSAQLFTASACGDIVPDPLEQRPAGASLDDLLEQALPDLDADELGSLRGSLSALTAQLGAVVGIADVGGAVALTEVGGQPAASGPVTTVFGPSVTGVRSTAAFQGATVAGDGAVLWSLALVNPLTGQVDALVPVDAELVAGECLDTATVGTPLAFHLDAAGGELLLFRVEDDGGGPEAELLQPDGRSWTAPLATPTAPPGLAAERTSGVLGGDLALVGQRVTADDEEPVVVALDRDDGSQRWGVALGDLADAAPTGEGGVWARAVAVDEDLAVVALARDDSPGRATYVGLNADDGSRRWVAGLDGPRSAAAAVLSPQELVLAVREGGITVYAIDRDEGSARPRVGATGEDVALTVAPDGRILLAADDTLTVIGDAAKTVTTGVQVADVAARVDGTVLVLLTSDDGAAVIAFGGR